MSATDDFPAWLAAIGTIAVAVMAIWGDWVRSKLAPRPRMSIEDHNLRGSVESFPNGAKAIFYHLRLKNSTTWTSPTGCRVLLTGIHRRLPNGEFMPKPQHVPIPFVWAPAGLSSSQVTISDCATLDFGQVTNGGNYFEPRLSVMPHNFHGYVGPNEAVRYTLQAEGDTPFKCSPVTYEVAWDGNWSENLDKMAQYLTIRRVGE